MTPPSSALRERLARRLRRPGASPDIFSTARSLPATVGTRVRTDRVHGYYIDFSFKSDSPRWPPDFFQPGGRVLYVALAQWALGCYERYLADDGEVWLAAARSAADQLVEEQQQGGERDGAWLHRFAFRHTFTLASPWTSAMAQGEGASILVRLHGETGDERYAEAAQRALEPMRIPSARGGVAASLRGGLFPEEYPTSPPSFVLNGGIFSLWGAYDVALALADTGAERLFREGAETLGANIHLYDTGYWSRYDLFPHPVLNVASSAYHALHTNQLEAMTLIAPDPRLDQVIARFAGYSQSTLNFTRAFARKVAFRLAVSRNGRVLPLPASPRRAR